jgi:hypothetical protein
MAERRKREGKVGVDMASMWYPHRCDVDVVGPSAGCFLLSAIVVSPPIVSHERIGLGCLGLE